MVNQPNRNNEPLGSPGEWQSCQAGELQQLGKRLSSRHQTTRLTRIAQAGAWCLLLVAVGVFLGNLATPGPGRPSLHTIGGITCFACVQDFEAYHAHLSGQESMPAAEAEQMKEHLAKCSMCRPKFQAMYPDVELLAKNGIQRIQLAMIGEPQLLALNSDLLY